MNTKRGLVVLACGLLLVVVGCSKSADPVKPPANPAATTSPTKPSTDASKGASKGSSAKTAAAAKGEKQKAGSKAQGAQSKAESKGSDYEDIPCDEEAEDVAFCGDDQHIVFCNEGSWYALDCAASFDGAFCGEESEMVDCLVEDGASDGT